GKSTRCGLCQTARSREPGGCRVTWQAPRRCDMTAEQVAKRLPCSATKVNRQETGRRPPALWDTRNLSGAYSHSDEARPGCGALNILASAPPSSEASAGDARRINEKLTEAAARRKSTGL